MAKPNPAASATALILVGLTLALWCLAVIGAVEIWRHHLGVQG